MQRFGISGKRSNRRAQSARVLLLCAPLAMGHTGFAQRDEGANSGVHSDANPGNSVGDIVQSLQRQKFDDALRDADSALKQAPKDKRIWTLRGMAYAGKGEPSLALASYRQAMELDPAY